MQKMLSRMLLSMVLLGALLIPQPRGVQARLRQVVDPTGFVVNSAGDNGDSNLGDGICSTGVSCTLRAALQEAANLSSSTQLITFSFSEKTTIPIYTPLPALSDGDQIFGDGRVTIDGTLTPDNDNDIGLLLTNYEPASVSGMQIQNFSKAGIRIRGNDKIIGGSAPNFRNVIINNGIGIDFATDNVYDNTIIGNYIGVAADGVTPAPNGIGINVATLGSTLIGNITIGGKLPGQRNVISGNTLYGIKIDNLNKDNTYLYIVNNYIGTTADGTAPLPNVRQGILLTNIDNTTIQIEIGGDEEGEGNLIAGNGYDGILLDTCWRVKIWGNKMSTNADASAYLPNQYADIVMKKGYLMEIGGDTSEKGNVLLNGVSIEGNSVTYTEDVLIQNNAIGITPSGAARSSFTGDGIKMTYTRITRTIGNRIAHFDKGINLVAGTNNTFSLNRIFGNLTQGIDLDGDGITLNDKGDVDTGSNTRQNFPRITSAQVVQQDILQYLEMTVTLSSSPNTPVRIELFSSPSCHSSGYGEGYDPLRNTTLTTDEAGNLIWTVPQILYWPHNEYIGSCLTATATAITVSDTVYNTSEFSAGVFIGQKVFLPAVLK